MVNFRKESNLTLKISIKFGGMMNLSKNERMVLELVILGHMAKGDERIYPEDIRIKFTPEVIQFTLFQSF